ncbi:MAG TPA: sodium/solute symporter [Steroidobacteraceae bacterium]|nr:sodium/solute symporter [Steroidobacteraceae bacterium]
MPSNSHAFGLLGLLDWAVVAAYTGGLIFLGLLMSKRRIGPVDYFLASRATTWPVIGLALLASNMSSTALVGLAGGAYALGISVYDYEWSAIVILVFFCLFLLPSIIRSQTYTMPEFLERRYDRRVRLHFALLTLFLNIFVDSAGVLYSGSLVCQLLFPGWPLWLIVALLAGTAGLYTTLGGLRAVIYTEAVQAVVLMLGALMISIGAFSRAGGWHAVMRGVDPAAISLIRPIGDPSVPWPGLLLGIPLLGFYYWCTNQSIVQRMLSAKNIDHARWGALFAGLLKLPVLFLIVLPGTCALLLFPKLARPDLVYSNLILMLLPTGLVGLIVAGFVAATMVSIASMLNSASTLITMDVVKQLKPRLSDAQVVRIGRMITVLLLAVAVGWAPQLQLFPSLWQYLQAVLAYAVPPVVALFLVGMFWRGASADGAAATMLLGSLAGFVLFIVNAVLRWTHLHFLYAAPLLTALDAAILVGVSLRTHPSSPAGDSATVWKLDFGRAEQRAPKRQSLWQDYRVQAAVLLALTAAIVIAFR